jgi:hypothetical protein
MRRLMRLAVTLGALSALAVMAAPAAHADVVGGGDNREKYMTITGGNSSPGGGGGGGGAQVCDWRESHTANFHFMGGSPYTDKEIQQMLDDPTGTWYSIYGENCPDLPVYGWYNVFVANGEPAANPRLMADELRGYLKAPSLTAKVNPQGRAPVKMPVWFYIDDPGPQTISVTGTVGAGTAAFQTATLTATAKTSEWDTGEGILPCPNLGEKWKKGTSPMATSDCSHEYETAAEVRNVSAKVFWPVRLTATGVVLLDEAAPPPLESDSPSVPMQVVEVQTINR